MSTETILAVAFLAVAVGSLAVHVSILSLIVRTGPGTRIPGAYERLRGTLLLRVVGGVLYAATGAVAVFATPVTALIALLVFAVMAVLYAASSIRDGRYWRTQRALEGQHGPGTPRRPTGGRHSRTGGAGANRPGRPRPSPVPRTQLNRDSRTGWPPARLH